MNEWTKKRLEEHLLTHDDVAPPWAQFPTYTRHTIGWRMGSGESWLGLWWGWITEHLPGDEESRLAYLKNHPPAPRTWANSVYNVLWSEFVDIEPEMLERLMTLGLVADDVAISNWLAQLEGESLPWHDNPEDPAHFARYWDRDLTFWCRWNHDQLTATESPTREQRVATLLDTRDSIPEVWRSFAIVAAVGSLSPDETNSLASQYGVDVSIPPIEQGWARLAMEMAAAGWPPPPWVHGLDASTYESSYEMDAGYTDAWYSWVYAAFDDLPTWRSYLSRYDAAPSDWEKHIKEHLDYTFD